MKLQTKTVLTVVFGLMWAGAAIVGGRILFNYENSPGEVGQVSPSWPANSTVKLAKDRPTLVMLAHPLCPCTRASVSELAQLMARVQGKLQGYVLFYTPRDSGADWQNTDLRRSAAKIPGITVQADIDGAEAERFGAETSGHTFLFDPSGRLLFSGGITASRGHQGDNPGENAIVSLLNSRTVNRDRTFVFGCSLKNRNQPAQTTACRK